MVFCSSVFVYILGLSAKVPEKLIPVDQKFY